MKHLFTSLALCLATIAGFAQCEADHTVEASSFMYAPMSLTIEQGQSVAFVNNQGLHDVNGVTNTITGEPFNNPTEFSLDAISGDAEGACMGIVTFDVAGTYNYDCSIGNHAEQGMVGTIIVNPAPVTTTIWDIVEGSDDHNYLEAALLQQGLDGALNDTTVLTLFAPTDAAFEAAAAAYGTDIAGLLALPYLTDILLYHVTGGAVMSTDLSNGQVVTMLNEGTTTVTIDMGVFINNAQVTGPDNTADNGVVHILDAVIQPAPPVTTTIWDIVEGSDNHNYLEAALLQQGLDGALNDTTVLTLFAPTDAAFEAAAAAYGTDIAGLLALPYLTDILLYHVTGGAVMSTDLSDGQVVTMLNEGTATVTIDMGVFINNAQVTGPDNTADNGVVHILDAVIQPAPPVATTIWDIVVASEDHTYLEAALLQEGLDGALSDDSTLLTLFAPTDAALEAAAAALSTDIAGVLALPNLTDILLYHVTAGAVLSTDLSDGLTVSMLNDAEATITIDENGVFVNDAQVTTPDLTADNGVVHVIDGVLLPPTDGIQEAQASWTVMPNPASFEVRFAGLTAEATAVVLDMTGRQVAQLAAGNNVLPVGHMAPGTYVVAVTSNGSITTSKLVVR